MSDFQDMVQEFMAQSGQLLPWDENTKLLRAKLIAEEAAETIAALGFTVDITVLDNPHRQGICFTKKGEHNDLEAIDGACDLLYVTLGLPVSMGIDLDPHFVEVHRANMTKLGGPIREDGKQLKPEGWKPPDHASILARTRVPHG